MRSTNPPPGVSDGGAVPDGPPRLTPLRELQLLEIHRAKGPDSHRALTELLAGYQRRIYTVCLRMVRRPEDAADLTQDVLLKLVENLDSYDGRSKLSTWVIRVAMNASLSHLRKGKVRAERPLDSVRHGPEGGQPSILEKTARVGGSEPSPAEGVEQNQRRTLVMRALQSLDADTRAVLVLRDVQDLDYEQLADVLDVPLGTVKSRLFRARAMLREAIEALGGT
jgi:RNA polymerase sigma-70 factor (ECF subfamily)